MSDQSVDLPEGPKNIFFDVQERRSYRLYISDIMEYVQEHIEAVDLIRSAGEDDEVHIYITSPGGYTDIMDMYLAAIVESRATIITHGIGGVCSAAVSVFLSGDVRIPEPGSYYMIHNVQTGHEGDSALLKKQVDFFHRFYKEKYFAEAAEILTKEEMDELFDRAGEIYLTAQEMAERLSLAQGPVEESNPAPKTLTGKTVFGTIKAPEEALSYTISNHTTLTDEDAKEKANNIVTLPFPTVTPKLAEDFDDGDDFDIILDDGYRKTFYLSKISEKDFDEYTREELAEIGQAFGCVWLDPQDSRSHLVKQVINILLVGANGSA